MDVDRAIRNRQGWILRQFHEASRAVRVLDGDAVMYHGRQMKIEFTPGRHETLVPDLDGGRVIVESSDRSGVRELVRRWFLNETSAYVVRMVSEFSNSFPRPSRVDVREMKKWGYCTRTGRLSFSWQLAALPEPVAEYVVLHELTHLVHFDHSPAFKKHLWKFCPDYRQRERELNAILPYDGRAFSEGAPPG